MFVNDISGTYTVYVLGIQFLSIHIPLSFVLECSCHTSHTRNDDVMASLLDVVESLISFFLFPLYLPLVFLRLRGTGVFSATSFPARLAPVPYLAVFIRHHALVRLINSLKLFLIA